MGETSIEWTDFSFNPWHGCQRVSPGCESCYAEAFAKRVGHGKRLPMIWGPRSERKFFGDAHWAEPLKWNRKAEKAGKRARVFCASMADVFEDREDLVEPRARLFRLIEDTSHLTWLLLTKRAEKIAALSPGHWMGGRTDTGWDGRWPKNVWIGTTVEDQRRAEERIPWLLEVPAAVRFISCEPLLGAADLRNVRPYYLPAEDHPHAPVILIDALAGHVKGPDEMLPHRVDWVIVGSESGPGARPMSTEWAASIVGQCRAAGVAVFTKQIANKADRKGGDPQHWPPGDWPREFPRVVAAMGGAT